MELPRRSRKFCSVPGCLNRVCTSPNLNFHDLPHPHKFIYQKNYFGQIEKVSLQKVWMKAVGLKTITKNMKVCSNHFEDHCYFKEHGILNRRLKNTAVPSLNLQMLSEPKNIKKQKDSLIDARQKRYQERQANQVCSIKDSQRLMQVDESVQEKENETDAVERDEMEVDDSIVITSESSTSTSDSSMIDSSVNTSNSSVTEIIHSGEILSTTHNTHDACAESKECADKVDTAAQNVTSSSEILKQIRFIHTIGDNVSSLVTLTGIPKFEILEILTNVLKEAAPKLCMGNNKLSAKEKVLLTMVKLKHNVSYSFLAVVFGCCSVKHCERIINKILDILGECLECAILWPSKQEILKNIPLCFADFKNVRAVIDCTEIAVQSHKNLCCQVIAYSQYKSRETLKIMTAVTPGGIICFKSKIYGGRVSDTQIFKQSGMINLFEPGDALMTDKGFLIDDLCHEHNIDLIRPPFLKDKTQFCKEESLINSSIACARVHVERVNQRMKEFKVLGDKMPSSLVSRCQQIVTVICAIVNLSAPIFKNNKFHS